jgi:hypothetical protein
MEVPLKKHSAMAKALMNHFCGCSTIPSKSETVGISMHKNNSEWSGLVSGLNESAGIREALQR